MNQDSIKNLPGGISIDDRGHVRYVNDFTFTGVKRFYQVSSHKQGFVRAWHGHLKENKFVYVVKGSIKLALVPLLESGPKEVGIATGAIPSIYYLSASKPSVLHIPGGYANGFQTLEPDTIVMFFSTSSIEESIRDDFRFSANDFFKELWEDDYR